jgi:hypothetical protein
MSTPKKKDKPTSPIPLKGLFGSTPIHMDWGGLRGFQSLVSQNPLQSISIPSNPYGFKITEQARSQATNQTDTYDYSLLDISLSHAPETSVLKTTTLPGRFGATRGDNTQADALITLIKKCTGCVGEMDHGPTNCLSLFSSEKRTCTLVSWIWGDWRSIQVQACLLSSGSSLWDQTLCVCVMGAPMLLISLALSIRYC